MHTVPLCKRKTNNIWSTLPSISRSMFWGFISSIIINTSCDYTHSTNITIYFCYHSLCTLYISCSDLLILCGSVFATLWWSRESKMLRVLLSFITHSNSLLLQLYININAENHMIKAGSVHGYSGQHPN